MSHVIVDMVLCDFTGSVAVVDAVTRGVIPSKMVFAYRASCVTGVLYTEVHM